MRRKSKRLKLVVYNIVFVLVFFTALEGYFKFILNNPNRCPQWLLKSLRAYYMQYDVNIIQYNPRFAHYDSSLFYKLNEGAYIFGNREFRTHYAINSMGFRDDEASLDYPEVVVLGDSYAMGWGVEYNQTFAHIVEEASGLKVLNMGISSYGTVRELQALEGVKLDSLKFIILQYCPNDYNENVSYINNNNKLDISSEPIWQKHCSNHARKSQYYPFKHLFRITGLYYKQLKGKKKQKSTSQTTPEIDEVTAFLQVLKTNQFLPSNVPIILFSLEAQYVNSTFINKVSDRVDLELGSSLFNQLRYVDLTGKLDTAHRFILDPHLNGKGHYVVANALMEAMNMESKDIEYKYWMYPNEKDTSITAWYKNGLLNGRYVTYWENGTVSMVRNYVDGIQEGLEIRYDSLGAVISSKNFINGQEVKDQD